MEGMIETNHSTALSRLERVWGQEKIERKLMRAGQLAKPVVYTIINSANMDKKALEHAYCTSTGPGEHWPRGCMSWRWTKALHRLEGGQGVARAGD